MFIIILCLFADSGLALGAGLDNSSIIVDKKPPAKAPKITQTLGSKPGNTVKSNFHRGLVIVFVLMNYYCLSRI